MKIYLVRHGQTDWHLEGKIQGSTDISLNEVGRQQAACLVKGMENRPVVQIFSSPLKRAVETAAAIGKDQNVDVEILGELTEVAFGDWEGMTWAAIKEQYPKEYERWCINPVDVAPPGGELQADIRRRCRKAVDGILAQAHGDLAIVAHGAILAYLVEYLMRDNPLDEEIIVKNASITTVEYQAITKDLVMVQMNDVSHLPVCNSVLF